MPQRKIIHCDCDCFYAAVEMRDDPSLREVALAVGGDGGRGVVATCNYAARAYGVRSAMAMGEAHRLCPDLVVVPPDMARYRQVSRQVMGIFRDYTPLVEPLSVDEAFLDVSETELFQGSATLIARDIRRRVREEVGITVSAGVAGNKFLAKVASDWNKPDGLFVVLPEAADEFVRALPIERLFGVGKVTANRLHELGVSTCNDLQAWSREQLAERFGRLGLRLYEMSRGIDPRPVVVSRPTKSISVERTFGRDLPTLAACEAALDELVGDLALRLKRKGENKPMHKLFVKLRFSDFSTHTQERIRNLAVLPQREDFLPLLRELYGDERRPVRLLGLGVRYRVDEPSEAVQLRLFD